MEDWSEIWVFALFLGKALWYALAGGVIMGVLDFVSRFFLAGGKGSNKLYLWALGATFLLGMFVQWQGMYQELEHLKKPQPVTQDEGSRKTIDDLRQQLNGRDIEIQELKRLKDRAEDAASRRASENAALNNKLHDIQNKIADKAVRKTQADKLAKFLHDGETIKLKCFNGLTNSPQTDFSDWHNQILGGFKFQVQRVNDGAVAHRLPRAWRS